MPVNPGAQTRLPKSPDGKAIEMKAAALLAAPVQAGAALRHRRLFHPTGVLARGTLERLAPPGEGLPMESNGVVGRVSKGIGTPGALPDFAGLAWRLPPAPFAATPWDVLLVSAGFGRSALLANRALLRPVTGWAEAPYSSLMPLRHDDQLWWIRAELTDPPPDRGLGLDAIADRIGHRGLVFDIEQASGTGAFRPLGRLALVEVIADDNEGGPDTAFDPVRHTAPYVQLWPRWLKDVREVAYRSSRRGRRAG